jgi:predicted Fe-Mo cluster-binding NifX family protein
MVKIVFPIENFDRENSIIFQHFGRAPNFALVTLTQNGKIESIESVQNVGEHFGGYGGAEALALRLNADAIVVKGMGPRGLQAFQERGITVLTGDVNTVGEAIDSYISDKLKVLIEPCEEARHK